MITLHEFQKKCVLRILNYVKNRKENDKKGFLLNLSPGMGKTIVMLNSISDFVNEINKNINVIILCPKNIRNQWKIDICKIFELEYEDLPETYNFKVETSESNIHFIITPYSTVVWHKKSMEEVMLRGLMDKNLKTFIIIDESQIMKNPKSNYYILMEFWILKESIENHFFFFLSGTPIVNSVDDLKSMDNFLQEKLFLTWDDIQSTETNLPQLQHKHIILELDDNTRQIYDKLTSYSESESVLVSFDLLQRFLCDPICLYKTQYLESKKYGTKFCSSLEFDEINVNLTEKTNKSEIVSDDEEDIEEDMDCRTSFLNDDELFKYENIAKLQKCKFKQVLEILTKEREDKEIIIVFCRFIDVLENLHTFLAKNDIKAKKIDGSVDYWTRESKLKNYLINPDKVKKRTLLCSLKTCSLGLNFNFASKLIIMDPFWNQSTSEQVYSRILRLNQKKNCLVYWLIIKDSIDEHMLEICKDKEKRKIEYIESEKNKKTLHCKTF